MTETNTQPRRRWLLPALLASLALNLLIVGIIAGWVVSRGGETPDRVARDVGSLVGPQFFRALDPDDRRALVRDVVRQRDRIRENRAELRGRIERLLGLMRADALDQDAVRAVLEEQRAAVGKRHATGEQLLLDRLSDMTAEERRAFADRLAETIRRGRRN